MHSVVGPMLPQACQSRCVVSHLPDQESSLCRVVRHGQRQDTEDWIDWRPVPVLSSTCALQVTYRPATVKLDGLPRDMTLVQVCGLAIATVTVLSSAGRASASLSTSLSA